MALAYLLDPTNQYQNVAGVNNVAGWFEVFISGTPERADVYVDFAGTRAPERIGIDNDGRAVMVVDGDGVYRVEMHAPNGDLLWTQYPVWPVGQGGGGAIGVDIGSSDGSVDVQRTQVGSVVNYDLSVAADGTDLLVWGEFAGYTMDGTHMVPSYSAGTIVAGQHGIMLQGGQYYHVTVSLGASSVEQNVYDAFQVSFRGVDGEGAVSTFSTKSFHYDASTGEGQSYDVSFDVMPSTDVELYAEATGLESGISVGLAEVYVHRVYSGAPAIPGGVAEKEWVEENYQEKLTPGTGIEIDSNNVISTTAQPQVQADWAQSDSTAVDYIKNKPAIPTKTSDLANDSGFITGADLPTVDQTYDDSSTNAQSGTAVADAIAASLETFFAVYGVTTIGEVDTAYAHGKDIICRYNDGHGHVYSSQLSSRASGIYTFTTTDGFRDYEFTLSPDGGTGVWSIGSRVIPSGTQLVPEATQSDAGEVLTVDQNGVPEWAPAQAPISAGNGIDITNNVISVDTSVVATQNDLAGKQDVISDLSSIRAGAALGATAVQDPNYVHTDENFTSAEKTKLAGIEAGAEANVQSDWAESDSSSDSFIRNKPGQTSLVAGTNITIVDDAQNNTVTISATGSAQVQADWAETDSTDPSYIQNKPTIPAAQVNSDWNASSGVAQILNKPSIPVIGTITL